MKTDEEKIGEIKPYENKMDELFLEYFNKLEKSIAYHRNELPKETSRLSGIHVFYNEVDKAIYVGRTDDIRSRIHHHTREGSKNGSATYAFNTAKKEFEKVNGKTK